MDNLLLETYIWPAFLVAGHSLLILVALLLWLAFFMYAERKIWGQCICAADPMWSDRLVFCRVFRIF